MKAKVIQDEIVIEQYQKVEGNLCVTTYCKDYEHYRSLPDVIEFAAHRLGKTGWNSDTNRAHYQTRCLRARIVLLPEEMNLLSAPAKVRAENEYADRHQFSS